MSFVLSISRQNKKYAYTKRDVSVQLINTTKNSNYLNERSFKSSLKKGLENDIWSCDIDKAIEPGFNSLT